jgi:hypothetical protein
MRILHCRMRILHCRMRIRRELEYKYEICCNAAGDEYELETCLGAGAVGVSLALGRALCTRWAGTRARRGAWPRMRAPTGARARAVHTAKTGISVPHVPRLNRYVTLF